MGNFLYLLDNEIVFTVRDLVNISILIVIPSQKIRERCLEIFTYNNTIDKT